MQTTYNCVVMSGMFAQSSTTSVTAGEIDEQSRIGPRLVMHSCELHTEIACYWCRQFIAQSQTWIRQALSLGRHEVSILACARRQIKCQWVAVADRMDSTYAPAEPDCTNTVTTNSITISDTNGVKQYTFLKKIQQTSFQDLMAQMLRSVPPCMDCCS